MARQVRTRGAALAGAVTIAVLASGVLAAGASAHTPAWKADCDTVTVDLTGYSDKQDVKNSVSLTIDGENVLDQKTFGASYHGSFPVKAHTVAGSATLVVTTTEDPKSEKWNLTETKPIAVCLPASPSPTASPSPSPSPTATRTATPASSTSAPATPAPSSAAPATTAPATVRPAAATSAPALAQTGGGSGTALFAALGAAVVLLGGALLLLARRRRAESRH
ncbi:LPXTG cell wall anchor domain-containing protein [Kitasatospora sp. NPDC057223]|uniref:LPXTG cell wall anchor domain-containing protein n=1 Tax=Kitasatospora sp. NPDC057223 TaxID=3346055 RepID=UPI003639388B